MRLFPFGDKCPCYIMPCGCKATLNDLSTKAAKFTNATVALHQLQSALEIHRFNLNLAAQEFASRMGQESNPITTYHQQRLAHSLFRIQQDIAVASATQEAVNTALNYLRAIEEHEQTVLAKRQEKSNDKNQLIIAVFGLIIGLGQIIDGNPIIMLTRFVVMVVIGLLAWWWYQRR